MMEPETAGGGMSTPSGDVRSLIQAARRQWDELGALLGTMEKLTAEHEELRARCERLDQEHERLRLSDETARRERDETARSLAELRLAYDALLAEQKATRPGPRKRKVMVVDDAASDLRMMESILRSAGHLVLAHGDGADLEESLALERPDLLLLDIVMPNRNGYEILRAVKKDERTKHIPVVMVSSRDQESDRVWSKRQGAEDYVTKPFTPAELLAVVQRFAG